MSVINMNVVCAVYKHLYYLHYQSHQNPAVHYTNRKMTTYKEIYMVIGGHFFYFISSKEI